ncbi:MAG TPA: sulfotransferase domain-containing protein [Acidimicrobiales bacterium]|nr:sulfotransferase domain-containing protein [Acidimicrobiales bacterium]
MLPTFLVIGARKSGTSSLFHYLGAHPEVFVTPEKEPKYFLEEGSWHRGLAWYESLFDDAGDAKARGELSTDYSIYPMYRGVPARIASLLPDVRLIYVMRHPIDRMRSCYAFGLWMGTEHRPIDEALLVDARYAYESRYALQIEQYLTHFPSSQLLLITAEELRYDRAQTMQRVFSFIGVDPLLMPDTLEREFNTVDGREKPRPWARRVGDILIRSGLDQRLPPSFQRIASSRHLREPITADELRIDDQLAASLVDLLRQDLESLRRFTDPTFDCWGLLTPHDEIVL